jgi:FtsZ-binding cell division protein ZapB
VPAEVTLALSVVLLLGSLGMLLSATRFRRQAKHLLAEARAAIDQVTRISTESERVREDAVRISREAESAHREAVRLLAECDQLNAERFTDEDE